MTGPPLASPVITGNEEFNLEPKSPGGTWSALWLAAPTAVAAFALAWLYGGPSTGDDTFIYMRYVGHFLAGQGFAFNPGEASAGITSPLWAFLIAGIASGAGNTLAVYKAVSAVLFALACGLFAATLRRRGLPVLAAVGLTAVLALEPHTLRWASSGMENGLACLCLVAVAIRFTATEPAARLSSLADAALVGLLPFARPEFALVSLGLLATAWPWTGRRARWLVLGVGVTGLALALAMWTAFGALVPQTAAAKAIFLRQDVPGYALKQSVKIFLSGALPSLVLLATVRPGTRPLRRWRLVTLLLVGATILYLGFRDHLVSTRYGMVLSFPVVVAALLLVAHPENGRRLSRWQATLLASQIVLSLALLAWTFPATRIPEHEDIGNVVALLRRHSEPNARVALTEIGAFGFLSDLYIVDLIGLTDRETLAWGRKHGAPRTQQELESLLLFRRADFYIDAFAAPVPLQGVRLRFEQLEDVPVRRRNLSKGRIVPDIWRIYRLRLRHPPRTGPPAGRPGGRAR